MPYEEMDNQCGGTLGTSHLAVCRACDLIDRVGTVPDTGRLTYLST